MAAEVVRNQEYGYYQLSPMPTADELDKYYQTQYFADIEAKRKAPEIRRQQKGGKVAKAELEWLRAVSYTDILEGLEAHGLSPDKGKLLDIGSGTGAFLRYASEMGWDTTGIEPSDAGREMAKDATIARSIAELPDGEQFQVITMLNVLEHVIDPLESLVKVRELLLPGGVACIRVPNDFSQLQKLADTQSRQWWIASPDHVNYFDFISLGKLCLKAGLKVSAETTDFPMELFLLMGDDYVANPAIGEECHRRRKTFEMALPAKLRRQVYMHMATYGFGRTCITFAVKG